MQGNTPDHWERQVIEECLVAAIKEKRLARRWGIFFKLLIIGFIFLMYLSFYRGPSANMELTKPHTALIEIRGEIGEKEESNADTIVTSLREAFEEKNAQAIMLRINSPGGSPVHASYVFEEIRRLRKEHPEKKVYAVISDLGASAAYFIAAAADEIYANSSSIVGSIGVLMPAMGAVDLLQKIGIEDRTLTAGEHKNFYSPFAPIKPDEKAYGEALLHSVHLHFIESVKLGRGARLKPDPKLFTGLFWSGDQALALGLIDGLGSAGSVARDIIKQENIVDYSITTDLLDRLVSKIGAWLHHRLRLNAPMPTLY